MTADRAPDRLPEIAPALRRAAVRFGTPCFVMDAVALEAAAEAVAAAFPDPWIRQYSLKANDVAAIVERIGGLGFGANVVSRGEWAIARRAGIADERTTFEGIGKTGADLRAIVAAAVDGHPLRWIAIESPEELDALAALAARAGLGAGDRPPLELLLRLNPAVAPETHRGLAVGAPASKFGMTETELTAAAERAAGERSVRVRGVHLHVGSQLGAVDAWRDAVRRGLAVVGLLRGGLPAVDTLDVGGGFPVADLRTPVPSAARFGREMPALLEAVPVDRRPARLAVEPGRALVARAGWLLARVLHARERGGPQVVLDAGMTELIRPAMYGAVHGVVALDPSPSGAPRATRVEGPICESTDALGTHELPPLRRGDLVAIRDAGAYASSQSSTYNGRPRAPQVLLDDDGRLVLVRRRGSIAGLG